MAATAATAATAASMRMADRCARCGGRLPAAVWPFGLEADVAGRRVGWLCEECEGVPGVAWRFIDLARARYPEVEFLATAIYGDVIIRYPLILPRVDAR